MEDVAYHLTDRQRRAMSPFGRVYPGEISTADGPAGSAPKNGPSGRF